jgi:hypothetical protein
MKGTIFLDKNHAHTIRESFVESKKISIKMSSWWAHLNVYATFSVLKHKSFGGLTLPKQPYSLLRRWYFSTSLQGKSSTDYYDKHKTYNMANSIFRRKQSSQDIQWENDD